MRDVNLALHWKALLVFTQCYRCRSVIWGVAVLQISFVGFGMADYLPPKGIPAPSFGINDSHRMFVDRTFDFGFGAVSYPEAGNGPFTHYVDNTHPAATDSSNPFGSPEKPRATWPSDLPPGSIVELHGGPYNFRNFADKMAVTGNGTAERPIFFRGASTNQRPVLGKGITVFGSYLVMENLEFKGVTLTIRPDLAPTAMHHHLVIRDNQFTGTTLETGSSGVIGGIGGWTSTSIPGKWVSDVVVFKNQIKDYGNWLATNENDWVGVTVDGYAVSNVWVLNNEIFHLGGDAVRVGSNPSTIRVNGHHVYVAQNLMYENRENALDIKQINDVVASENITYWYRPTSSSSGESIVIHYDPDRVWLLFNRIRSADYGVVCTACSNLYIIGNVFYDIHHTATNYSPTSAYSAGAAIHSRGTKPVFIINNTFYGYDTGIQIPSGGPADVMDNIFANRSESNAYDILYYVSDAGGTLDRNLFFTLAGRTRIGWLTSTARSVSQLKALVPPVGVNQIEGMDPRFSAPSEYDFNPEFASPVVNVGSPHAAYDFFLSCYGIDIKLDFDGKMRPFNGGWDLGAYEASGTIPRPPKRLRTVSP
jgi:hypothetical protein